MKRANGKKGQKRLESTWLVKRQTMIKEMLC